MSVAAPPEVRRLGAAVPFAAAFELQRQAAAALLEGTGREVVFLLEHEPVFSIGRLRDQSSLRDPVGLPHPVVETNRGGQATYHGPGQLVGYLVFDLRRRGRDLHLHLRWIEALLIEVCGRFGVAATRRDGLTGVWIAGRKLASIGVGVRRWISCHGFALNVTAESLPPFRAITPCGIEGVAITCLAAEAARPITVADVTAVVEAVLFEGFAGATAATD